MRAHEFLNEDKDPCWNNYKQIGMKEKNGKSVPNCVPKEGVAEGSENLSYIGNCTDDDVIEHLFGDATGFAQFVDQYGDDAEVKDLVVKYDPETDVHSFYYKKPGVAEDWQKVNKSDKTDGMSRKAVKAYRRENPGSKLKTAVTKKPSELKAGSKDAKRRKSFCARMSGVEGPMKDEHGKPTAKAKALKRWNC